MEKAQTVLDQFTNLDNEAKQKILQIAGDMEEYQDPVLLSIQLAKGLNTGNVSHYPSVNIFFTAAQRETLQLLVDSGDLVAAQRIILDILDKEFGEV